MSYYEPPTRTRLATDFTPRKSDKLGDLKIGFQTRSSSVGRKRDYAQQRLTSQVKQINDYKLCPFTNERDALGRLKPPTQYYAEAGKGTWVQEVYKSIASVKKQTREHSLELRTQEASRRRHSDSGLIIGNSPLLFPGSTGPVWKKTDQLAELHKGQNKKYSEIVAQAFEKEQRIKEQFDSKHGLHHSRFARQVDHDATIKNCILTPGQYEVEHAPVDRKTLFFKFKKQTGTSTILRDSVQQPQTAANLSPLKDITLLKKSLEPHTPIPDFSRMLARIPFAEGRKSVPSKQAETLDTADPALSKGSSNYRQQSVSKYTMFESSHPP